MTHRKREESAEDTRNESEESDSSLEAARLELEALRAMLGQLQTPEPDPRRQDREDIQPDDESAQ